jgi:hypothetical protein
MYLTDASELTLEKTTPMATLMNVMTARDVREALKLIHLPTCAHANIQQPQTSGSLMESSRLLRWLLQPAV